MMSLIFFVGCGGPLPEGWLASEQTGGPTVNYDVLAEPLPEIPLPNDQAIADVAAYVNRLKVKPPVAKIKGDTSAGKAAYMICQTCHGAKGEGNKALNAPKLINQQDWYMVRQLKGFKEGLRGTHPKDVYGMQMRPMSMTLADDEAINNVVSYIVTFK